VRFDRHEYVGTVDDLARVDAVFGYPAIGIADTQDIDEDGLSERGRLKHINGRVTVVAKAHFDNAAFCVGRFGWRADRDGDGTTRRRGTGCDECEGEE